MPEFQVTCVPLEPQIFIRCTCMTNIFVSYSRTDIDLIRPIVALLRINASFVFHDIDSIPPGKKWKSEIDNALAKTDLVVLFWCEHANKSENVKKERSQAVLQDKDILPILLDYTVLPGELSQYQWIDFREGLGTKHVKKILEPGIGVGAVIGSVILAPLGSVLGARVGSQLLIDEDKSLEEMAGEIEKEIIRRQDR